jgi:hypothetical protein
MRERVDKESATITLVKIFRDPQVVYSGEERGRMIMKGTQA